MSINIFGAVLLDWTMRHRMILRALQDHLGMKPKGHTLLIAGQFVPLRVNCSAGVALKPSKNRGIHRECGEVQDTFILVEHELSIYLCAPADFEDKTSLTHKEFREWSMHQTPLFDVHLSPAEGTIVCGRRTSLPSIL